MNSNPEEKSKEKEISTSIEPWLIFQDVVKALEFYKNAFGALETYRLENPDAGLVVKLTVHGANFWLSSGDNSADHSEALGGNNLRLILVVSNPYIIFSKAISAGAKEIFPVGEDYGWVLGRIQDPFGLHWEIGHPMD